MTTESRKRYKKDLATQLDALVRASGLEPVRVDARADGAVAELHPTKCGERRVAVFLRQDGVDAAIEVAVPAGSHLRATSPTSEDGFNLLGRLTALLSQKDLTVSLAGDPKGTASLLVKAHVCDADDATRLPQMLEALEAVAEDIAVALAQPGSELARTLADRLAPQLGQAAEPEFKGEPLIVPTHDQQQVGRLLELSRQLKGS